MPELIARFSAQTFALLRIVAGLMFAMHGTSKLFGFPPSGMPAGAGLPPLMLVAGMIELLCGLLIAIGFFTGIVAFIASGQMAVAYFTAHAPAGFCFVFLFIAGHGAGIWSIDNAMRRRTPVVTTA